MSPGAQGMGHPGHVEYVTDGAGVPYQYFHYSPWGESLISQTRTPNSTGFSTPYRFNAKELDSESGLFYYGARYYHPVVSKWLSVDPMAHLRESLSPYNYCSNNPILRIDPDGALDEPVYGSDGTYRGNTKEGFTGQVIIYDGDKDFSNMGAFDLLYDESFNVGTQRGDANTYDRVRSELSGDAKSKIWTHIVSQMEGQQIYDETFSMSSIEGGKIYYDGNDAGGWNSRPKSMYKGWNDRITGTDKYTYKTTVENIQSSVVVHEWYSHIKKGQGNYEYLKSHRLAYKNVINYKPLWNKTTDDYKGFNMRSLLKYTKEETGRTTVDPLYRNLYNKYKDKR
ncbi:RHS repeat-associated core domain-containing protein [Schleiferia thermophila]